MDEVKYFKELKFWGFFLVILDVFLFLNGWNSLIKNFSIVTLILVIFLLLSILILFWILTYKRNIVGPILGIIYSVLFIIASINTSNYITRFGRYNCWNWINCRLLQIYKIYKKKVIKDGTFKFLKVPSFNEIFIKFFLLIFIKAFTIQLH